MELSQAPPNFFKETDMTIRELLNKINDEKPHSFPESKIISFVNEVEPEVAEQLNEDAVPYYTDDPAMLDTVLLAKDPYSRLYVSYVKAQIDYANEEYASYQLNADQHTQDFRDFSDWVVRTGQATTSGSTKNRFKHTF